MSVKYTVLQIKFIRFVETVVQGALYDYNINEY